MLELVIFDLDGVLVDSEPISVRLETAILAELGWPLSEAEVIERFVGQTDEYMKREIERYLGRPLPRDWDAAYRQRARTAFETELRPVEGVVQALDRIELPSCVASNSKAVNIRLKLRATGLYPRFEGRLFSAEDVSRGKPAPDLFLHAAARLGVEAGACAVVEDSRSGVEAARAAGMRAFAYAGGVTPASRLEGEGTVVFDDMRQLPGLLA
jgi:HAD superfamily hydrolase (TIGR01509 family)